MRASSVVRCSLKRPLVPSLLVAVLFLLGMGGAPQEPQISIEGPSASLSGMFVGAGSVFMKISNTGGREALIEAGVNIEGAVVELHDVKDNRMFKVERIAIPARGTVELRPRSLHIMIFNMPKTVREGSEIELTLTFERSGEKRVPVRFGKPQEMQMMGGH